MTDPGHEPGSTPTIPDLSGRQFGNFHLLRRLGHGAMAEVYLAEQRQLARRVAVKILKPELAHDETYLKRFRLEAQAAASLIHANIVQIYEVGHQDQYHYIAQEYVEGQDLRDWIARNGSPDLPHSLSIMCQVAAALSKAGEAGVIHRDIKPENIMLTRSGEVKVADFGLARVTRKGEKSDLTQAGVTMGTPLYMSPEQVQGKKLDPRSDIYSFGITCFHMLTGSPPFSGETALAVAVQHLKKQPPALEDVRPDLPAPLCRVVHKMLAKDPNGRQASGRELLRELRKLYHDLSDESWPDELTAWDSAPMDPASGSRSAATQQLDALMKTSSAPAVDRRWLWLFVLGLAISFLLGGLLAWQTADRPLLPRRGADHLTPQTPTDRSLLALRNH